MTLARRSSYRWNGRACSDRATMPAQHLSIGTGAGRGSGAPLSGKPCPTGPRMRFSREPRFRTEGEESSIDLSGRRQRKVLP